MASTSSPASPQPLPFPPVSPPRVLGSSSAAPKGILKTPASRAMKRQLVNEALLQTLAGGAAAPICLKVLVMGGRGAGKSALCRALAGGGSGGGGPAAASAAAATARGPGDGAQAPSLVVAGVGGGGGAAPLAAVPAEASARTLGIETTTVLIASFRGRPVYLHLWDIPFDVLMAPMSPLHLDLAFSGAHAALVLLDARDESEASVSAVEEARDELERRVRGNGTRRARGQSESDAGAGAPTVQLAAPSGLGSRACVDAAAAVAAARSGGGACGAAEGPLPFPMYLLAHKADHAAAAIAAQSVASARSPRQRPGLHFADAPVGGELPDVVGSVAPRYPLCWYAASGSSRRLAHGMSADDLGRYAKLCGFRGWWWTSTLPSIAVAATSLQLPSDPAIVAARPLRSLQSGGTRPTAMVRRLAARSGAGAVQGIGGSASAEEAADAERSRPSAALFGKAAAGVGAADEGGRAGKAAAAAAAAARGPSFFGSLFGSGGGSTSGGGGGVATPSGGSLVDSLTTQALVMGGGLGAADGALAAGLALTDAPMAVMEASAAAAASTAAAAAAVAAAASAAVTGGTAPMASLHLVFTRLVDDCLEHWGLMGTSERAQEKSESQAPCY